MKTQSSPHPLLLEMYFSGVVWLHCCSSVTIMSPEVLHLHNKFWIHRSLLLPLSLTFSCYIPGSPHSTFCIYRYDYSAYVQQNSFCSLVTFREYYIFTISRHYSRYQSFLSLTRNRIHFTLCSTVFIHSPIRDIIPSPICDLCLSLPVVENAAVTRA